MGFCVLKRSGWAWSRHGATTGTAQQPRETLRTDGRPRSTPARPAPCTRRPRESECSRFAARRTAQAALVHQVLQGRPTARSAPLGRCASSADHLSPPRVPGRASLGAPGSSRSPRPRLAHAPLRALAPGARRSRARRRPFRRPHTKNATGARLWGAPPRWRRSDRRRAPKSPTRSRLRGGLVRVPLQARDAREAARSAAWHPRRTRNGVRLLALRLIRPKGIWPASRRIGLVCPRRDHTSPAPATPGRAGRSDGHGSCMEISRTTRSRSTPIFRRTTRIAAHASGREGDRSNFHRGGCRSVGSSTGLWPGLWRLGFDNEPGAEYGS